MIAECAHIYDDGHRCRRIPARGQEFCPGHRDRPRLAREEALLEMENELRVWAEQAQTMCAPDLINEAHHCLRCLARLTKGRISDIEHALVRRAIINLETIETQLKPLHAPQLISPEWQASLAAGLLSRMPSQDPEAIERANQLAQSIVHFANTVTIPEPYPEVDNFPL